MMARTSCSRTSKLTSLKAFTPPKARDTPSTARMTSPMRRPAVSAMRASSRFIVSGRRPARIRREGFGRVDGEVRTDTSRTPILETHLGIDRATRGAVVERAHDVGVLLADEAAPDLARARELAVVGVELLVQDHEAVDLASGEARVVGEIGVHLLDALADEPHHLRLRREVRVAGIGDAAALGPV